MLTGNIENSTIRVIGNSFLNITSHHYTETGVLSIRTRAQTIVDVLDNTFLSCFTFNSVVGSLFIRDNANHSIFYIEKNSFKNGFGAATGGIFLDSNYSQQSVYNFKNNQFHLNKNENAEGHSQDVVLWFSHPPKGWTESNMGNKVKTLFKGSKTDVVKDSFAVVVNFSSTHIVDKHVSIARFSGSGVSQGGAYIIGMIIGGLIVAAVFVIVILFLQCKKRKFGKSDSTFQENAPLFAKQYESI